MKLSEIKTISPHALAAKMIRADLKRQFPGVKFSVRSESFAGGDAVRIKWTDGPTTKMVDGIVNDYQEGHFDGMYDIYEYSNRREDIPQVKYVQTRRDMSREVFVATVAQINRRYGWSLVPHAEWNTITKESNAHRGNGSGWQGDEVHRTFYGMSLYCTECHTPALVGDRFCAECGAEINGED